MLIVFSKKTFVPKRLIQSLPPKEKGIPRSIIRQPSILSGDSTYI